MAGPNAVQFVTPVPLRGTPELTTIGEFTVEAGESVPFTMSWYPSHHRGFRYRDPHDLLLGDREQLARLVEPLHAAGAVARAGHPLADHAEDADL